MQGLNVRALRTLLKHGNDLLKFKEAPWPPMHKQERRCAWFAGWVMDKMHIQPSQLQLEMVEV